MSIAAASQAITVQADLLTRLSRHRSGFAYSSEWLDANGQVRPDKAGMMPTQEGLRAAEQDRLRLLPVLRMAEPMYIAPAPCELISDAAFTIPDWPLRPTDMMLEHAFVLFASPPRLTESVRLRALTISLWGVLRDSDGDHEGPAPVTEGRQPDGLSFGLWTNDSPTVLQWRFGRSRAAKESEIFDGWSPPAAEHERRFYTRVLCLVSSLLSFLQQRIVTRGESHQADRASRRRADEAGLDARDVEVVTLRRAHSANGSTPVGDARDWSCRWWVAGHWRQQPYGKARSERRPTWITPYVKGPDDKPLVVRKRLFAVTR